MVSGTHQLYRYSPISYSLVFIITKKDPHFADNQQSNCCFAAMMCQHTEYRKTISNSHKFYRL